MKRDKSSVWNLLRGFGVLSHRILYTLVIILTGALVIIVQNQQDTSNFNKAAEAHYPLLRNLHSSGGHLGFQKRFNQLFLNFELSKVGLKPSNKYLTLAVNQNKGKFSDYEKKQIATLNWASDTYDRLWDNRLEEEIRSNIQNLLKKDVVTEVEGDFYIINSRTMKQTPKDINYSFVERGRGEFNPRYIEPEKRSGAILDGRSSIEDAKFLFNIINKIEIPLIYSAPGEHNTKSAPLQKKNCIFRVKNNRIFPLDARGDEVGGFFTLLPEQMKNIGKDLPDGIVAFDLPLGYYRGLADDLFFSDPDGVVYIGSVTPAKVSTNVIDLPGVVDYYNDKVYANEFCRRLNNKWGKEGAWEISLLRKHDHFPFKIKTNNPETFQVIGSEDINGIMWAKNFKREPRKIDIILFTLEKIIGYWRSHRTV
jgi:hypothetical protein